MSYSSLESLSNIKSAGAAKNDNIQKRVGPEAIGSVYARGVLTCGKDIVLANGTTLHGTVRFDGDSLIITDVFGKDQRVATSANLPIPQPTLSTSLPARSSGRKPVRRRKAPSERRLCSVSSWVWECTCHWKPKLPA